MSSYIPVPVDTEPVDLAANAFDYLQQQVPGWLPADGNLEAWLIESLAQIAGELRTLVALVPDSIFAYYGASILGLPPHPAVSATALTTWTMSNNAGYTVQAGTVIAITPAASQTGYGFAVNADFTVAPGQTVAAGVQATALEPGAAASGLTGTVQIIDQLTFVSTVTLDTATSGGADAETSDEYLSRLSALLTLLTPRPILPQDFAVMAERGVEGVGRAVAIDLYNPGPPVDANCPRCVTVVIVDSVGDPVPAQVKSDVDALLQAQREVNFLVFVADPAYTTIAVTYDAQSYPGYDPAAVKTNVDAALASYLSPGAWGIPPYGDTSARSWINATKVRYLEVAEQINRVDGIHYINTLSIGVQGGTLGQTDVTMTGVAPLPKAGTITGAVHPEA